HPNSKDVAMPLSMYEASIPVFIRAFGNLSAILDKGAAFAQAQGMDPADLIQTRLVADMDPLPAQVQRASDTAKGLGGRLAGIDILRHKGVPVGKRDYLGLR